MADMAQVTKEKEQIIVQIKEYVPLFSKFVETKKPLAEYSNSLYQFSVSDVHLQRQKLFKSIIESKLKKLFGDGYNSLNVSLDGNLAFNIADHHQVLNHPAILGSNVISSVGKFFQSTKPAAIIVISSGDTPPNNFFSKNGFQLHGKQVPLFSVSERESTAYYLPQREFNFIERAKANRRWLEFSKEEQEFLVRHQEFINNLDFSNCQNYNDQITTIIKNTWPLLFESKMRNSLPDLLYITQEELVTEYLIKLLKEDNFITATLFNVDLREKVLQEFRGNVVAWRESEGKGTHFFWRKHPDKPLGLRMFLQGNVLVPVDERYKHLAVPLEPNALINLLEKREIYPSLFLIFSVLNFYAGVKPLTGYGSTVYLEFFRQSWARALQSSGFDQEIELIQEVKSDGFVAGSAIFFKRFQGKLKTLYAHDIMFEGGTKEEYLKTLFNLPFGNLVSVALVDMYDYFSQKYVPPAEKLKLTITSDDLAEQTFGFLP